MKRHLELAPPRENARSCYGQMGPNCGVPITRGTPPDYGIFPPVPVFPFMLTRNKQAIATDRAREKIEASACLPKWTARAAAYAAAAAEPVSST